MALSEVTTDLIRGGSHLWCLVVGRPCTKKTTSASVQPVMAVPWKKRTNTCVYILPIRIDGVYELSLVYSQ